MWLPMWLSVCEVAPDEVCEVASHRGSSRRGVTLVSKIVLFCLDLISFIILRKTI